MVKFSLRRLLASTALVFAGIGILVGGLSFGPQPLRPDPPLIVSAGSLLLILLIGPLIGAGIFNLFGRSGLGAIVGAILWGGFIVVMRAISMGI
jgi:hypothetical protein